MADTFSTDPKPQLVFPTDLGRIGYSPVAGANRPNIPYIEFSGYQWNVNANAKKNASIFVQRNPTGRVFLPLSEVIQDQQSINWETQEGIGAKNLIELGIKSGVDFLRGLAGNFGKFVESKKGKTSNDLQGLSFGLTDFREWNFNFNLMPKDARDSQRLAEVISFFKRQSIANFVGNIVDYPSFFSVRVHFPEGDSGKLFDKLLIFKTSVIANITVNYLPDNIQSFYRDGAPTAVSLELTMKELERVNRSEYNLGIGTGIA